MVDTIHKDAVAAGKRVEAILREAHPQAQAIILGQAAIEIELRDLHAKRCGRPSQRPSLKAVDRQLRETCPDAWLGLVLDVAAALTDLRNAVAHADGPEIVERRFAVALAAFHKIGPPVDPSTVHLGTLAEGVAVALAIAIGEADRERSGAQP